MDSREVWVRVSVEADDVDLAAVVRMFEDSSPLGVGVVHLHGLRVLTRCDVENTLEVEAHLYVNREDGSDASDGMGRFIEGVVDTATGAKISDVAVLITGPAALAHTEMENVVAEPATWEEAEKLPPGTVFRAPGGLMPGG